jgi:hypothetical protein
MKKLILLIIAMLLIIPAIKADGMIVHPHDMFVPENQQLALINWSDGREHLLLAIQTDKIDEKSAWIVPIPASPEQTIINILPDFPELYGSDIKESAKSELDSLFYRMSATQIYPIFFTPYHYYSTRAGMGLIAAMGGAEKAAAPGIVVHEHIEKEGIVTELITAKNGETFYTYLNSKGLNVSKKGIPVLDNYIGKDYSFVVSWILPKTEPTKIYCGKRLEADACYMIYQPVCGSNGQDYGNDCLACSDENADWYRDGECYDEMPQYYRRPAIFVDFPAAKPYYPLMPTSVYGSTSVPTTIYVVGLWKPETFKNIGRYTTTQYMKQDSYMWTEDIGAILPMPMPGESLAFTQVSLNAPSKLLSQDLYFEQGAPASIHLGLGFLEMNQKARWPVFFLFTAILSAFAAWLASLIAFRGESKKRFLLLGLANCASIIGLIIATVFTRTKAISPELRRRLKQERLSAVMFDRRKAWFIILFTIIFVAMIWILRLPLRAF